MPLVFLATNAAGVSTGLTYAKMVNVDNQTPTVAISGPSDARSTAGVQYITAAGSAGPSGVSRIGCSTDGAPWQWYPGASAQIPVSGIGVHRVTCMSANNARDASGNVATSSPATWTLSIRQPTVSGIGFSKLVNRLVCHRVRKRVLVPAHWVHVRRRHRLVRVRRRAHWRMVEVTRCHPRIVRRRITVWSTVIRHGRKIRVKHHKTIRVVLLPHVVSGTRRRIGHGKRTTVSGWVGLPDGTALAGQLVRVMAAADNNGYGRFRTAAVATTGPDGSWSAELPPGPSRLIEAVYDGSSILEPSVSGQVRVLVPARVKLLSVSPRRVPWGGTVRIVGQLKGGYLPAGGALVRLRIGFGRSFTTYGVQEHVTGRGRFSTSYTFGLGDPAIHRTYWFQVASLPMGNYPYEPAASRRVTVAVGGHPRNPPPRRHRRHQRAH
jgi:hypothetical protein